jgi:phospholipid/cholesterol/gamma-HCH transport system substrate-binding protein
MTTRWRRTWLRLRTVPGLGRDVAVIAALMVAGTGVGGYILSQQRIVWPWQDRISFQADFDEAPGISPNNGQEVRVAGVTVGEITAARVTDDGKARLTLRVDPDRAVLYDNSRLVLRPKSPLNEMYVNIVPGGPPGRQLRGGEVLAATATARPVPADEVLAHLDDPTRAALGTLLREADTALARAGADLPAGLAQGDAALSHLAPVTAALAERRTLLAELVSGLRALAGAVGGDDERLRRLIGSARTTLDALVAQDPAIDATLAELPGVTGQLADTTGALAGFSRELKPVLGDLRAAAADLPGALDGLTVTARRLEETLALAGPLIADARPLVRELRSLAGHARPALGDLAVTTAVLDPLTGALVSFLPDVGNFIANTASATSTEDANGPILRGLIMSSPDLVPFDWSKVGGAR